jgi:glycosyltransferase involved in cell wall biosynthesis
VTDRIKVAIAHDYLTQRGGAEKVVLAMARAFPDAPIYTTLYDPDGTYPEFRSLDIRTSPLNKVKFLREHHRAALPFLPVASSAIKIDADVVIASSSGWAHGFRTSGAKIVYCYSPARWLYQRESYLGASSNPLLRAFMTVCAPALKLWDRRAARSASKYFAISSVVEQRIRDTYNRESTILFAPQSLDASGPAEPVDSLSGWSDGFYLCVSRLLPYKNVDQVVRAFDGLDRRLVVVGTGPQEAELAELSGPNVRMVKNLTDGQMRWLYSNCAGLIAASYEDFGLTPLEAASYGKPSAVLRWGGFLDTVAENVTGVYFDRPESKEIESALDELERLEWPSGKMQAHLDQFAEKRFADTLFEAFKDTASQRLKLKA